MTFAVTVILFFVQVEKAALYPTKLLQIATTAIVQEEKDVMRMQRKLLGPYHDIRAITTSNISHAHAIFMQNVRARYSNWTETDWENAQAVMYRLTRKSESLYRIMSVSDRAKIKAVQNEFRELQEKTNNKT
ncbi:hypothetical protein ABID22_000550 [Pontibacter aydingkolensis]|uniref:DUF4168 domain-containing protein n=1 Tax=Pontibacter aydingkolensis TaxID=1911536 RepID=A0ABS7CRZ2_9BACT|nr:hypothetical protein [Pontibacter aydingkolensis]MBW7466568.1 hypothetical protein [Pontibacter aydingkolensis]